MNYLRKALSKVGTVNGIRSIGPWRALRWVVVRIRVRGTYLLRRLVVPVCVRVIRLLPTRLRLAIREGTAVVRRMDYERCPIYMYVDSWFENEVRLHSCKKEPGTIDWIESWFKPGDVFYDIGANIGAYSLVAFRFLSGKTKIYAF